MTTPTITPVNIHNFSYPDAINRRYWDSKFTQVYFKTNVVTAKVGGGAATGTAGDNNVLSTDCNASFEWFVIGTQTLLAPVITAVGLNITQDNAVAGDGAEYCRGITANCPDAFVVGTSQAFYVSAKLKVADASGCNPLILGFRKAAAFDATLANYTDFASLGIVGTSNPNLIKIQTQIATGGVVATDTTNTWADAATHSLAVLVSSLGVVTYQLDGVAPTAVAAYTFTNALTLVPFLRFTQAADLADVVEWIEYSCGYQVQTGS